MKNKKRVKPYIVIPIYAAVIALLTKMVSTCTDKYIDNRIYDQQINNMNYSVSQIQKYSYKYEEQPLEEAISSLRTTMGRDVANSVYLPGMDLFFTMFYRIPSGLRNITWFPENLYFSKKKTYGEKRISELQIKKLKIWKDIVSGCFLETRDLCIQLLFLIMKN